MMNGLPFQYTQQSCHFSGCMKCSYMVSNILLLPSQNTTYGVPSPSARISIMVSSSAMTGPSIYDAQGPEPGLYPGAEA